MFQCLQCRRTFIPIEEDCIKSLCRECGEAEIEASPYWGIAVEYWGEQKPIEVKPPNKEEEGLDNPSQISS